MCSFFIILLQVTIAVIVRIVAGNDEYEHPPPPQELTLRIKTPDEGIMMVNLVRVESVLANGYLPIMITSQTSNVEYEKLPQTIMTRVGEFAVYHDYCTKSAFIYFRREGILNGVVDVSYSVEELPIAKSQDWLNMNTKYFKFFTGKRYVKKSRKLRSIENINTTMIRSQRDVSGRKRVYPELLVAISYDMHRALGNNYVKTISHILTVYNAADMLYRFVKTADIKLNIAAIVIEIVKDRWNFIPKMKSDSGVGFIDLETVNFDISKHFRFRENYFPRDSYDFITYNTRMPLMSASVKDRDAHGVAMSAFRDFMFPPHDSHYDRCNIAVVDYDSYESFSTVAHELAHVFAAEHDGDNPDFLETSTCGESSIMTAFGCTRSCLKWSPQTESEFAAFFRSTAYCSLKNPPHSLYPQNPRGIFTGEHQCLCYGAHKFVEPHKKTKSWCRSPLQCTDEAGNMNLYPLPMDGTPCAPGKVCWHYSCVQLNTPNKICRYLSRCHMLTAVKTYYGC